MLETEHRVKPEVRERRSVGFCALKARSAEVEGLVGPARLAVDVVGGRLRVRAGHDSMTFLSENESSAPGSSLKCRDDCSDPAHTVARPCPALLQQRILVLDGAMGTQSRSDTSWARPITGAAGLPTTAKDLKGNNELLQFTRPEVLLEIHRGYLAAGRTSWRPTPSGPPPWPRKTDLAPLAREMNVAAARLARQAADEFSTPDKPASWRGPSDRRPRRPPSVRT